MSRSSLSLLAIAVCLLSAACERYPSGGDIRIRRDMVDQPSFRPQEDPRSLAEGSIPMEGWEAPMTEQEAEERLSNPVAPTAASLAQGERLYKIYCTPCHGVSGRGDGPVASKMMKAADLTDEKFVRAKDGLFYYVMRAGEGLMPPYAESIAPAERWHVINYVRKLQQR